MRRTERIELTVPPATATAALVTVLGADPAEPVPLPGAAQSALTATVEPGGDGGSAVTLTAHNETRIPFFGWFFRPVFRWELRRGQRWTAAAVQSVAAGDPAPPPLGSHPLSTPGLFEQSQVELIAAVAFAGVVTAFCAALFGQFGDPVAKTFHASDAGLGRSLAVTRLGALVALLAATMADRVGRRRILLGAVVGACICTGLSAIAPSFLLFTATQTLVRACVNTAVVVGGIAVVEEAPEGARAFAVSMLALASGAGYAFSVVLLPIADIGPSAWRVAFGVGAVAVLLVRPIARRLEETRRFEALAARTEQRGRVAEVVDRAHRRRLVLLGAVGFLSNVFSAPSAQLTNRFLRDERGFSNAAIAQFKGIANGIPGLIGIVLAGRLTETRGRRPVAVVGVLLGTVLTMVFFLGHGPVLWIASSLAIIASASGALSVGTMDAELFPTEIRGTANAMLLVCYVAGSAVGLVVAGTLADRLDDLGLAIALCGIAPIIAALLLLPRLPESSGRALDDVSPSEV